MTRELRTFLTFQGGRATAALDLYRSVFDDFELLNVSHYGPDGPGPEGTIMAANFRLAGSEFSCADSPIDHAWGFTPAVSMWIECTDDAEQQRLFDRLSAGGQVYAARQLRLQHPVRLGRRSLRGHLAIQYRVTQTR